LGDRIKGVRHPAPNDLPHSLSHSHQIPTFNTLHPPTAPPPQERIRDLEEEAMGDKPWVLSGEVNAGRRPVNSALEVDMDFETTAK
jgi:hypothetical protein